MYFEVEYFPSPLSGYQEYFRYISLYIFSMTLFKTQLTLQPSQVKAPKWKPAAGSPHTLHVWFICKIGIKKSRVSKGLIHWSEGYIVNPQGGERIRTLTKLNTMLYWVLSEYWMIFSRSLWGGSAVWSVRLECCWATDAVLCAAQDIYRKLWKTRQDGRFLWSQQAKKLKLPDYATLCVHFHFFRAVQS